MPSSADKTPEGLKPYHYHGCYLVEGNKQGQAAGDCPFCGKEGKFSVQVDTSKFRCWVCGASGNALEFLRQLWKASCDATSAAHTKQLADDRRLLFGETPAHWGAALSILTRDWLVPGHNGAGNLCNLYRRIRFGAAGKYRLLPTPEGEGIYHGVHGLPLFDKSKKVVYLCEGVWDAMCLWETMRLARRGEGGRLERAAGEAASVLAEANVLAIPSCGAVGRPLERLVGVFAGKHVVFMPHSDHPTKNGERLVEGAGFSALKRACTLFAKATEPPEKVSYLHWGAGPVGKDYAGYDPARPSGYDVRDMLTTSAFDGQPLDIRGRIAALNELLSRVQPIEPGWVECGDPQGPRGSAVLSPLPCASWQALEEVWHTATAFHEGMSRALSIELASILSTGTMGDPIWLKVVGPPSCGKTTLAEALDVARKYVKSVSIFTGLHSGYKTDKHGDEDHSLIAKIDGKTLIIKDGSTLLKLHNLENVLAQLRDLYDCVTRAHYGHGMERNYEDVRCTVHINGTETLRELDDSCLGARFVDVVFPKIDDDLEWKIAAKVYDNAMAHVGTLVGSRAESRKSKELVKAMRMTGGYIEHLRRNAEPLIQGVAVPPELKDQVIRLGLFVAHMRARPPKTQAEVVEGRELAGRLVSQYARLARCLAAAMSRRTIDAEVYRRVRQTALDTARGKSFEIARHLYGTRGKGLSVGALAVYTNTGEDKLRAYLSFLKAVEVVEFVKTKGRIVGRISWRLTPKILKLWKEVVETKTPTE